jgi:hypothetical protein
MVSVEDVVTFCERPPFIDIKNGAVPVKLATASNVEPEQNVVSGKTHAADGAGMLVSTEAAVSVLFVQY